MSTTTALHPRAAIARAVRICHAAGIMGVDGHVSARDDDADVLWINDRHAGRSAVTAANVVPVDLATGRRRGDGVEPPSEIFIHCAIYRARPEVRAIVHAHPENVLVLSAIGAVERPSTSVGTFLAEAGAPLFDTPVLVNTAARGEALASALGAAPAAILRQHGAVTVGGSIEEAVVRMICLDDNARKQGGATVAGGVKHLAGGEYATLAVENWGNATEKFWLYHLEEALRNGALAGLEA